MYAEETRPLCEEKVWHTEARGQIQPLSVSVDKVLLKHSHAHLFMCRQWLLSGYNDIVEELSQRPYGLQSLKYFLFGPLQSLSIPGLGKG